MTGVRVERVDSSLDMLMAIREHEELMAAIARRAYQLFEERGAQHGRDLDDWLAAESQVLFNPAAELRSTAGYYEARLNFRGLALGEVIVTVGPEEMVVSAEGSREDQSFQFKAMRHIRFPERIDADSVNVELVDGILRVTAPRRVRAAAS